MNKELEALNDLRNSGLVKDDVVCFTKKAFEKRLDIIEAALQEQDFYKNQLECAFEAIKNNQEKYDKTIKWYQDTGNDYFRKTINSLKALEIIKRNPLMICAEYYKCIVELKLTYQEYLKYFPNEEDRDIKSEEEYNLLKEVLL